MTVRVTHARISGIPNDPALPDEVGGEDWDAAHVVEGLGTAAEADAADFLPATAVSTFGASLVDDADAATARSTLGLAAVAATGAYSDLTGKPSLGTAAAANTGTSSGNVPVLDGSGKLDTSILPSLAIAEVNVVASQSAMLALTAQRGDLAIRTDLNKTFALSTDSPSTLADWKELLTPTDAVLSVAGLTGAISASALKTALSLNPGTDVQAYDAELAALAGLVSAANKLPYFTGSGTAALADLTAAGRALIDDADAAAQRTTLGLGTAATAASTDFAPAAGSTSIVTLGTVVTGTWNGTTIAIANGGTGSTTAAGARTALGLAIGTDVQAYNTNLGAIAGGTWTGAASITTLGTIATGTWQGTAVAVAYGGTGAATASAARTNLGLAIGTNVQAYSATLDAVAAGTYTGATSITTLGTIATGTWSATAIGATKGGTGLTSYTTGDLLYGSASNVLSKLGIGSTNQVLTVSGGVPTWSYSSLPQNPQSAAYTCVLSDAGGHLLHPSADTTARTFTIPANSSVAYPIGTAITFVNQNGAGTLTIAITTDTMRLAGAGTTGSRTLAANGIATALKIASTEWIISGTGLT